MASSKTGKRSPAPADPRPEIREENGRHLLVGGRCGHCGLASACVPPICPCGQVGGVEPCTFGPSGTVFSSTVLEIPVPGRTPPVCLAYVDLDEGPRILAHVELDSGPPPEPGARVSLNVKNDLGDLVVSIGSTPVLDNHGAHND